MEESDVIYCVKNTHCYPIFKISMFSFSLIYCPEPPIPDRASITNKQTCLRRKRAWKKLIKQYPDFVQRYPSRSLRELNGALLWMSVLRSPERLLFAKGEAGLKGYHRTNFPRVIQRSLLQYEVLSKHPVPILTVFAALVQSAAKSAQISVGMLVFLK